MKSMLAFMFVLMPALSCALPARAGIELAQKKNCLSCHMVDQKLVGPAYRDVAAKYAGRDDAVDLLSAKVQRGGTGVWGSAVMPPNPVTPEEARDLVTWILSLKKN
jgi:cytochrome c